jgi:GDP-mannose 6-dehydrogenase
MRINIFGMGYVGSVSAACLTNHGHTVVGIDIDDLKVDIINSGKSPIIEPGLEKAIKTAVAKGNLRVTRSEPDKADVSIVCVGTPSNGNGSLKFEYLSKVVEQIGDYLSRIDDHHVVNIRSTVLPGTVENMLIPLIEKKSKKKAGVDFGVCMNPEFMREGTAMYDYVNPPLTMIGELDIRRGDVVAKLYENVKAPMIRKSIRVAEMLKYSCNAFHAMKVSFANEIGNICKSLEIDSHEVMDVFCKDTKLNLSSYYLKLGFAFGGSCLPKDLRAILYKAKELDIEVPLLKRILQSNQNQIEVAFNLIRKSGKKKVGFLGLSFKPGTDDLRESPMVELIEKLIGKGYSICLYDKQVSMAKIFGSNKKYIESVIPHISTLMKKSAAEAIENSEIVVFGKKSKEYQDVLSKINGDKYIIDLARVVSNSKEMDGSYEGICW